MQKPNKKISDTLLSWILPGIIALLVFFGIRAFWLDLKFVSASDMEPTLTKGDLVLINKLRSYAHDDILAFKFVQEDSSRATKNYLFIQRCIGVPGDTVRIFNGYVYVNSIEEPHHYPLKFNYYMKSAKPLDSLFLLRHGLTEGGVISDELDYSFSISRDVADSLVKDSMVKKIEKKIEKSEAFDEEIFPHNANYKWNKYNFESLYIPKKGDTLRLDTISIHLYKRIISDYENNLLEISGDSIIINKTLTKSYVVQNDYYFVMGDNRDNAIDSRYWGFLPKKRIVGKISRVVFKSKKK